MFFYKRIYFLAVLLLLFFSNAVLVKAATSSVNVEQTVIYEGDPTPTDGGGVVLPIDATPPEIYDLTIYDITKNSAKISWKTDEICLAEIYYGDSGEYEFGPIKDHADSYLDYHSFYIEDLNAGTKYYIKIKSTNPKGAERIITDDFFTVPEFTWPLNVSNLSSEQNNKNIFLSWKNPVQDTFSGVQISRSKTGFLQSPLDGEVVFKGLSENFIDSNIEDNSEYYYTLFSYDSSGNFSSGVSIFVTVNFGGGKEPDPGVEPDPGSGDPVIEDPKDVPTDVTDLNFFSSSKEKKVYITWDNSENLKVEIRKSIDQLPSSPYDGELIYEGYDNFFEDNNVENGETYYYSIFLKNQYNIYSDGKSFSLKVNKEDGYDFSNFIEDLSFVDIETSLFLSVENDSFKSFPDRNIGVIYNQKTLPEEAKSFNAKIGDSVYNFNFDSEGNIYKTDLTLPSKEGNYDIFIYFLDEEDKYIYQKNIEIIIESPGRVYEIKRRNFFEDGFNKETLVCYFTKIIGEDSLDCLREVGVSDAEIEIFKENEDGEWENFNSESSQKDRLFFSDKDGKFELFVPNGKYKIFVKKDGYEEEIITIKVVDNLIKNSIKITRLNSYLYAIILVIMLLLFIAIKVKKSLKKRQKIKAVL